MAAAAPVPVYQPAPVQVEFHACPANEILIGGAAGGTKSMALLMDPIQSQLLGPTGEHARWTRGEIKSSAGWAIHFRREFPRLEQTIERAHRLFKSIDSGAHWDSNRHVYTFSCGYRIQFGHIATDLDRFNYLSNEYSHIAYDELWEFSEEVYQFVNTRLRSSDPVLQGKLRIVAGTNPAPNWVRGYFVDPCPEGRKVLVKKLLLDSGEVVRRTRIFIPATLKDNPDAGFRRRYEIELQDKPAHIRRSLLYGDWYVIAGAFFAHEFTPAHVVAPFKVPSAWPRFRVMDWGFKAPGCVLWCAVDMDGNLIFYRELTFQGLDSGEVARKIRDIETTHDEWDGKNECSRLCGPADTQIWSKSGTLGPTIIESMQIEGVSWEQATKNRHASVAQLLKRLKDMTGDKKTPAIRFFNTCRDTIRTIPSIGTDPKDPELPADGGDDHWLDAVLYACMYRVAAARQNELPWSRRDMDELEEARRTKMRVKRKGRYGYGQW